MHKRHVLLSLIIFAVIGALFYFYIKSAESFHKKITSPVPDFLTMNLNNQVSSMDLFAPSINYIEKFIKGSSVLEIGAKSALVYDLTTHKVLYEKDPDQRVPIASLTKVMTAIIALENQKSDNKYYVSDKDLVGEDSMGLSLGEVLSLEDLLYGLFLHSGNDAAETIASNYIYGRYAFINAMNQKAQSYGLKDTNFTNPTGLEGDGSQYSTAYDLLVISKHLLAFPKVIPIMATFDYDIPATQTHKEYILENETNLISSYPGVKGIKTGYTPEAGLCLITYLDYRGHKIIGIILGSENRRQEMKDLLDYSLLQEGVTPPKHQ